MLGRGLPQIDFYDSRRHLGTLPGAAGRKRGQPGGMCTCHPRAGPWRPDRVGGQQHRDYLATLLAALAIGAVPCAVAPPPTPSREESAGVQHLRAAIVSSHRRWCSPRAELGAALCHGVLRGNSKTRRSFRFRKGQPRSRRRPTIFNFTSGSTSAPKAVLLSHRNVAHNIATVSHGMATARGGDRLFSWLPMYPRHGLHPKYSWRADLRRSHRTDDPLGFLRDPLSWVRNMTHHRSSVTAGPTPSPTALRPIPLERSRWRYSAIELSDLRCAYIGRSRSHIQRFAVSPTALPVGLRSDVLVPSYGMAESVLAGPSPSERRRKAGNIGRVKTLRTTGTGRQWSRADHRSTGCAFV